MHAAGRPAKATGVAVLLAMIATAGCVSSRNPSRPSPPSLSPEDARLAEAMAHYAQGLIYEVEGRAYSSNALQQFADASRLDPSRVTVNTRAAVNALLQDRPAMAVEALERTCRAYPKSVEHLLDLATAYELARRPDDAIRAFRRALAVDPARQNARVALATLLFLQDRDSEALAALRQGMGATPDSGNLLALAYAQGTRFYQNKNPRRAIPCFTFVLEHATQQQHDLETLIGELYEEAGERRMALRCYRRATRDPAPAAQAFVKLALAEFASSPEGALAILADADRRLPDNAMILITRGQIEASREQTQAALATFERVVQLVQKSNPRQELTENFYLQYALMLEHAGQQSKSEAILELCIRSTPAAANALNFLAYSWAEKATRLEQALEYVQRALQLEPDCGAFLDTLGWIYFRMGRHADAALAIQHACEVMAEDPTVLEHLGDVLDALGCKDDAAVYWQRSLHADPARKSAAERLRARGLDPAQLLQGPGTR
jgi:tetratricopeptide (TPR) repeat protein